MLQASDHLVGVFFQCFDAHRDLHSFPTRRSSDLGSSAASDATGDRLVLGAQLVSEPRGGALASRNGPRSEEHTSELQSPDHLGCRLLLEKKKPALLTPDAAFQDEYSLPRVLIDVA